MISRPMACPRLRCRSPASEAGRYSSFGSVSDAKESGACRLIVHYEVGTVEPLFIYAKNDRTNIEPVEIGEALRAAGLIGEAESS